MGVGQRGNSINSRVNMWDCKRCYLAEFGCMCNAVSVLNTVPTCPTTDQSSSKTWSIIGLRAFFWYQSPHFILSHAWKIIPVSSENRPKVVPRVPASPPWQKRLQAASLQSSGGSSDRCGSWGWGKLQDASTSCIKTTIFWSLSWVSWIWRFILPVLAALGLGMWAWWAQLQAI